MSDIRICLTSISSYCVHSWETLIAVFLVHVCALVPRVVFKEERK